LHDLVYELDLRDAVTFLGQISQTQLADHYQRFDLLVVPSQNEPFGLVALEAVACGTPAVVAKSGGLAELIHPPFILGYDMADDHPGSRHLDEKVLQVLARRRSADFAWQAATYAQEHYALARYVQQLESIYRQVLPSSHPGK
jgi:glycosyltransferase involved in cell wall biosynthesis